MDIFIIFVLFFLNGIFAMAEIAIVSSRKVRLQQWAEEGHRGAIAALKLADEPTRFLSTIQIGITLIGILSGAFGEAAIADRLIPYFASVPLLADIARPLALGITVLLITYFSLIIGELVPKRIGMQNPEVLATVLAPPMLLLARATRPLVRFLSLSTETVLRVLGIKKPKEPSITEEEIKVLMEQGAEEGIFERAEQELVENIFSLDEKKVVSIMTQRKDIIALDIDDPLEDNLRIIKQSVFTRYPVCKGGFENVLGMIQAKDLLHRLLDDKSVTLTELVRPPLYVPEAISPMQLLEQFKRTRNHTALVVDEYGEIEGLVSINDVMEAIVGDLPTEASDSDEEIVQRDDGSWLVDGMMSLDDFKEHFDLDMIEGEETGDFQTVAGFVIFMLGRVPATADRVEWGGFTFEVVDMDRTRVDKLLVTPPPPEVTPEA
ncbi:MULTISPECIES: hemolysin family protein [Vogesella]|uniref:hemolysin family protein n=1 Tax=Vogesella TaxID=57739 RepID=UPI00210C9571|nr:MULTISPECIES: hemolysin family protein [Vogesella]MCQ4144491.1 hemolysin family protein [Vogesella sp. AC12]MDC7710427.1 hemolysin family protein [Vogesella indigofera]